MAQLYFLAGDGLITRLGEPGFPVDRIEMAAPADGSQCWVAWDGWKSSPFRDVLKLEPPHSHSWHQRGTTMHRASHLIWSGAPNITLVAGDDRRVTLEGHRWPYDS